jgi:hypothetical protein
MKRKTLVHMNKEILLFGLSPMVVSVLLLFLMGVMLVSQVTALLLVIPIIVLGFFLRKLSKKGNSDLVNSCIISSGCPESVEDNKNIFRFLITDSNSSNGNQGTD